SRGEALKQPALAVRVMDVTSQPTLLLERSERSPPFLRDEVHMTEAAVSHRQAPAVADPRGDLHTLEDAGKRGAGVSREGRERRSLPERKLQRVFVTDCTRSRDRALELGRSFREPSGKEEEEGVKGQQAEERAIPGDLASELGVAVGERDPPLGHRGPGAGV